MIITQLKLNSKHQDELERSGLRNLSNLAYFSADHTWVKEHIGYNMEGLIIPYFDPYGKPYKCFDGRDFYRFKPEWGKLKSDDKPKYLSRKGEGCRPYFPQSIDWEHVFRSRKIPIYFTEGEKKTDRMAQTGYATIGMAGIWAWLDSSPRADEDDIEASRVLPELRYLSELGILQGRECCICFDSDVMQKWQVKIALKALANWIEEMGGYPKIILLPTEPDRQKNGADDFIVRHGEAAFAELVYHAIPAFYRDRNGKRIFNLPTEPMFVVKAALAESILADRWKYRPNFGWYRWKGSHWALCEDGRDTQVATEIYQTMDANGWGHQSKGAMQDLLCKLRSMLCEVDGWNPPSLIAFSNGVLDLNNDKFTPHSCKNLIISVLPYQYAPGLTCYKWLEFLVQALAGEAQAIDLVQAFFRWSLTPKPRGKLAIECAWDLFGEPGAGKGTILETLRNLVGRDNAGTFRPKYLSNANAAAAMLDKRVSICSDSSGAIDDPGLYNEIVSNEPVPCKFLYKNIQHITLNTFLVRAYNAIPPTPFGSQGLDRRIIAMAFNHTPKMRDITLQQQLNAELSGIFNWAWSISEAEMVRRIATAGEIQAVIEASVKRFEANNPAFVFLCEIFPNGEASIKPRELYSKYAEWSRDSGFQPLNHRNFVASIVPFGVYQKSKIMGFCNFSIPAMRDFNIIAHLGIDQKNQQSISNAPSNSPQFPYLPPKLPYNAPTEKPGTEPIIEKTGELGEKPGKKPTLEQSQLFDLDEYAPFDTSPHRSSDSGETGWDDLPTPKPPEIDRQLSETVMIFSKKAIAAEWENHINIALGVTAWKPKKVVGAGNVTKWHVRVINVTQEQIDLLAKVDTNSPPVRPLLWRR